MKRETFIFIVCGIGMFLGTFIVLGNKGVLPDYSFYIWPWFIASILVIILTHPISVVYHRLRRVPK